MPEIETVKNFPPSEQPSYDAMHGAGCRHISNRLVRLGGAYFQVVCSYDPFVGPSGAPDHRWHVSVTADNRVPTWAELVALTHWARPGVMFCAAIPPPQFWFNIHPNCLHSWEIKDETLVRQWRAEGAAHQARGGRGPT